MTNGIENDALERTLRDLQPAPIEIDESAVFFAAGYRAASAEGSSSTGKPWLALACAALFGGVIMAPASYHLGSLTEAKTVESQLTDRPTVSPRIIVNSAAATADELTPAVRVVAEPHDEDRDHESLFVTLAARWLLPETDHARDTSVTLTASHSAALKQADFQHLIAEMPIGRDDRYRTFSTAALDRSSQPRTLSVRDTNAMTLGDL